MGCTSCATNKDGKPAGCKSNGWCSTGGCNKMNTYDYLTDIPEVGYSLPHHQIVEVSFKNGSRKGFFRNENSIDCHTGDMVLVESEFGWDLGQVSLSGELVRLQMKKRKVGPNSKLKNVLRLASDEDLQSLKEAERLEKETLVQSRVIARSLGLDMKIGDVEFQADKRKATFYYTADGRVDFRELIKIFARDFKVKIEMRQIGARQEAGLIGGLGSCGRELCCSTWLTDFKTVGTSAARYQSLAVNQSKLSGQCGRLKCCLNYELDVYVEATKSFPKGADKIETENGVAFLQKTDVLKQIMYYGFKESTTIVALEVEKVKELLALLKSGKKPQDLISYSIAEPEKEKQTDYADVVGQVTLRSLERSAKKKKRKKTKPKEGEIPQPTKQSVATKQPQKQGPKQPQKQGPKQPQNQEQKQQQKAPDQSGQEQRTGKKPNKNRNRNRNRGNRPDSPPKSEG